MAGIVYLRTNRFEVKLEGITFRTKDFESLCSMDFLFPDGKVWARPPIVGLDVMRHPRDPSSLLVLLCFGVGCVILKFRAGEPLPPTIHRFLLDKRIHFVGFGIPEKKDLFPFDEMGLTKNKVDIGYLAAKRLKDPKYKTWELAELARKVLGIKRMIGLTESSSFERHEQIKCAICQLFITSVIAMGLLRANDQDKKKVIGLFGSNDKKLDDSPSPKKSSFLKNLNSLHLLAEGWFKMPKIKKRERKTEVVDEKDDLRVHTGDMEDEFGDEVFDKPKWANDRFISSFANTKIREDDDARFDAKNKEDSSSDELFHLEISKGDLGDWVRKEGVPNDDCVKEGSCTMKKPLKGILKCPSTSDLRRCNSMASKTPSPQSNESKTPSPPSNSSTPSPHSTSKDRVAVGGPLKRANSKGFNVSFKCQELNL